MCPRGRGTEIQGQLVPEQEVQEVEGAGVVWQEEQEEEVTLNDMAGGSSDENTHRA